MKTTAIRNRAAAALLFLPLAAAVVATPPAHAQPARAEFARPAIERFVLNTHGRIEPGKELRFRLRGVPGAQATVDIPGVMRGIAMTETRPGVYEADYTVRRRDDPRAFERATAVLRVGNQRVMARVDVRGDEERRDEQPPRITDVTPGDGVRVSERGRVHLFARLGDEGSGVDPASVRLRLDGRDVTGAAQVTADEVRWRDDLREGRHTAEIEVRDRSGNATRKAWSFEVVRAEPPVVVPVPPVVRPVPPVPPVARDASPPRIFAETPAEGIRVFENARVHLAVRFDDEGSGVDPATVRLRLDGRDVTSIAQVSAEEVRFREDLRMGRHTAEIEVRDRAGNASRKSWTFEVVR
ncbi:hypothetical protein LZ009_01920 [Ramlibacter sp. XY19]|uniref:hypothetical protein n=1 Tax=Ramlibacter paludis TaxID=2908000 RepID=UPI0023DCB825|nr:hypothetical protein [Ramlibacter paludis]MCG2591538.1 hypothetical protein [Ramlibacter paludis]